MHVLKLDLVGLGHASRFLCVVMAGLLSRPSINPRALSIDQLEKGFCYARIVNPMLQLSAADKWMAGTTGRP